MQMGKGSGEVRPKKSRQFLEALSMVGGSCAALSFAASFCAMLGYLGAWGWIFEMSTKGINDINCLSMEVKR